MKSHLNFVRSERFIVNDEVIIQNFRKTPEWRDENENNNKNNDYDEQ